LVLCRAGGLHHVGAFDCGFVADARRVLSQSEN
jgi:hypothetical protein